MRVQSLAFRTDLALLEQSGSTVEDCGDHLVVRTPHNPTFFWGNFLLLAALPGADDVQRWLSRFESTFPDAGHRAIGVDALRGTKADVAVFETHGLTADVSTVMTAQRVHPPARPNRRATYRPLTSDDDWHQQVELSLSGEDASAGSQFATRRTEAHRSAVAGGHGIWFGAFEEGRLLCSMGLFRAGDGLARFQTVKTDPEARGRGLAGTLVHLVSEYGFSRLGARTLVMVADPSYPAIRVYRAVGFTDGESQLQVERHPA